MLTFAYIVQSLHVLLLSCEITFLKHKVFTSCRWILCLCKFEICRNGTQWQLILHESPRKIIWRETEHVKKQDGGR